MVQVRRTHVFMSNESVLELSPLGESVSAGEVWVMPGSCLGAVARGVCANGMHKE